MSEPTNPGGTTMRRFLVEQFEDGHRLAIWGAVAELVMSFLALK